MRALAVKYLGPRSGAKSASVVPSDAPGAPPAGVGASPSAAAPTVPAGVPNGSFFSRSRNLWEDPDGNLFDLQGRPVK